ncbi:ParB/RepB/Spo0J family partition protein [Sphingorhabdus sp.]|jgi:ParB family chromosome partitioning protein|uniref:ParB/RepB/Spo0J family partition protein n=1 Tax=Sphingorhabdus sp. TaxID=1902408 RepID=UPI003BAEF00A|nr:ParB/RepB/Spo0J family partition protein [Sphingomonadales bacterium]MBK9432138.1 ParB/RepB/Spo0J family partition protein [Sphingomonadales bacterium]MBL0023338.1 ParB/RepB/Spo0J family partition protein [Sphingomonadales bacterium]
MSEDAKPTRKRGLGRGLDALLGEAVLGRVASDNARETAAREWDARSNTAGLSTIAIADIHPNPAQPRRHFDEAALVELADSIAKHGLIQPVVVRPHGAGYQIVAGERRWRAAQKAQLHEIRAIVRELTDAETLEIALIENIQRRDLNPIEEGEGYKRLIDEFGHSQAELAALVHKSRSHVANMMRLLDLPKLVRELVVEGKLSMGHARALLPSDDAARLAALVIKQGLSVRQTEALVKKGRVGEPKEAPTKNRPGVGHGDADIRAVEQHLGDLLGLKVRIVHKPGDGSGSVTFDYRTLDQLDMLCQRLTGEQF